MLKSTIFLLATREEERGIFRRSVSTLGMAVSRSLRKASDFRGMVEIYRRWVSRWTTAAADARSASTGGVDCGCYCEYCSGKVGKKTNHVGSLMLLLLLWSVAT